MKVICSVLSFLISFSPSLVTGMYGGTSGEEREDKNQTHIVSVQKNELAAGKGLEIPVPTARVVVLGAGKKLNNYPLNYYLIDKDESALPDLVRDISQPLDSYLHGSFDYVVGEHLPDYLLSKPYFLTNVLDLLKPSGLYIGNLPMRIIEYPNETLPMFYRVMDLVNGWPFVEKPWELTPQLVEANLSRLLECLPESLRPYFKGDVQLGKEGFSHIPTEGTRAPFVYFAEKGAAETKALDHFKESYKNFLSKAGFEDVTYVLHADLPIIWSSNKENIYFSAKKRF